MTIAFSLFTVTTFAQDFKWGITAGANFNYPTQHLCSETSYQFGLKGEYSLGKSENTPYATASLLYSRFPWFRTYYLFDDKIGNESIGTDNASYAYLGMYLPVHIGYKFNVMENIKLFVNAGPYVSMKVGTNSSHSLDINNDIPISEINMDDFKREELSNLTWGVGAEAGLELADKLQMHVSYNHGFTKMRKGKYEPQQNTLSVGMSWLF